MTAFHIFSQSVYLLRFFGHAAQSPFLTPQNAVYFTMFAFFFHKIFKFYRTDALKFKCPTPKGLRGKHTKRAACMLIY
jgi:hypothetical protein